MIAVKNLSFQIGARILFNNAYFNIPYGAKVGIVGHNGCGKTTLFRIFLNQTTPDAGEIFISKKQKIVSVQQEIEDQNQELLDFVLSADLDLVNLMTELEQAEDEHRISEICEALNNQDGFSAESRVASILSGLGFGQSDFKKPLKEFSGGWQMRAALAATLFAPSDIILLDEPTNHLDFETSVWLENYLAKLNKTILMVSHEKYFLNSLCDNILHVHDGSIKLYAGNYDSFVAARSEHITNLSKEKEKQEKTRKHLQSFVDRFRYKASKAKQAQSRIKMLEKMKALPTLPTDYSVKFEFPQAKPLKQTLIEMRNGLAGYDDKIVLENLKLRIEENDRIAILGANGNGKSTLAKILSRRLNLLAGELKLANNLQVAYFSQQQTEELNLEQTAYEALSEIMPDTPEPKVRAQLARFGLTQEKGKTLIKNLSGGEKTRLTLAIITRRSPHVMIMDEPTNHLDIEARKALIDALNAYSGAVVLITHDFYAIEATCDRLLLVHNGSCEEFNGDLEEYKALQLNSKKSSPKKKIASKQKKKPGSLEKELEKLEAQLESLSAKKLSLEQSLNEQYDLDTANEIIGLTQEVQTLESQWLASSSRLEKETR